MTSISMNLRTPIHFVSGTFSTISVVLTVDLGTLMTQLLPVLMMRHRRVPRAKWQDHVTPTGKHWIEHVRRVSFFQTDTFLKYSRPLTRPDDRARLASGTSLRSTTRCVGWP